MQITTCIWKDALSHYSSGKLKSTSQWYITSNLSGLLLLKKKKKKDNSVGKDVEKLEVFTLFLGIQNGTAAMEDRMKFA